jgi:putative hydrolase of the HAD superfamily
MNDIRAVCFDLDDTLRDPAGGRDALLRTCRRVGAITGIDSDVLLTSNSETWPQLWREVEEPWTLGGTSGEIVTTEAWRRTLEACDHGDPESAARAAQIHLEEIVSAQRLFDDARILLDAIAPDIRLALITNGASDTQRAALLALGVEHRFDAVIVSGEVGIAKPEPEIFELALDTLGAPAEQAWHVGDNPVIDVAGAKAAGLTAVWLNRGRQARADSAAEPDLEVGTLLELRPYLRNAPSAREDILSR